MYVGPRPSEIFSTSSKMKRLSLNERNATTLSSVIELNDGPWKSKPLVRLSKPVGASKKGPPEIGSDVAACADTEETLAVGVSVSGSTRSNDGVKRLESGFGAAFCAADSPLAPIHASELYAKNLYNFLELSVKDGALTLDWTDELIAKTCVTHAGEIKHEPTKALVEGSS